MPRTRRAQALLVTLVVLSSARLTGVVGAGASQAPGDADAVLARAMASVADAIAGQSSVVCEERYVQVLRRQRVVYGTRTAPAPVVDTLTRTLVSDYLLVHFPDTRGWVPFRDVYSVDGSPVRDRENRLLRLFVEFRADRLQQAEAIRVESSRYNLGSGTYDINVPTFALQFMLPSVRERFRFRPIRAERVDDVEAVVFAYEETARPTIITGAEQADVPAAGLVWVAPDSGRVLRTRLDTTSGSKRTRIDVRYGLEPASGAWVPLEMHERHSVPGEDLESTATYSRFRQFRVETVEQVKQD